MVKLVELLSFVLAAVGLGLVAYPNNSLALVAWFGGTATQVGWIGLGLIALAVYVFQKRPKSLERKIA